MEKTKEKAFSSIGVKSFLTVVIVLVIALTICGVLSNFIPQGSFETDVSELFRRVTGQSFTERLAVLKTRHAKTLLSQGFSVTDACFRSGFGSTNNFLYTFKKLEGVAPSEYKKRLAR